jgi:HD-GYP domain-containing protein (c-di-GMP phosphodiesterase class II)
VLPEESQDITEARGAGGQFDPAVVDAFSELVVELVWPTAPAPSEVSGGGAR